MRKAKRCSFVERTRFCASCGQPVAVHHKYQWTPLRTKGHYKLTHRQCSNPGAYPKHTFGEKA